MKRIIATALLLQSQLLLAESIKDQYSIELSGQYYLALPKSLQVALKRPESQKLPSCDALNKDLAPMLSAIEQCGTPGSKKDEFCKYTVRLVRQKVLGIKSEITQSREADAKQLWNIDVTSPKANPSNISTLASELNTTEEQIASPSSFRSELLGVESDISNSKLLTMLAKLDDRELSNIQLKDQGDGKFNLITTSRAVTCELLSGNINLQIESDVAGTFDLPADQNQIARLWKQKQALEPLVNWRAKQDRYKFIIAGHRLAEMEDQDRPEDIEKNVLAASEVLFDLNADEFKLVPYKNKFAMAQRLPQTKVESHYHLKYSWNIR